MYLSGSEELKATVDKLTIQMGIASEAGDRTMVSNLSQQINTYRSQLGKALNDERVLAQQRGIIGDAEKMIFGIPPTVVFLGLAGIAVTVGLAVFLRKGGR